MAKARQRVEWDYTGVIWVVLANANRDEKKRPKPYTLADIHPLRSREELESEDAGEPEWALLNQIFRQNKVTKLSGRKDDQSRRSVPRADDP